MLRYLDDYESISIHSLARGRTTSAGKCVNVSFDFNPLPRKRENCYGLPKRNRAKNFNPLPRKRENGGRHTSKSRADNFNPLPRKRENSRKLQGRKRLPYFNPLPRKRENCIIATRWISLFPFQSTPSQEGERGSDSDIMLHLIISIHSLARGRTQPRPLFSLPHSISIHSLARGRTACGKLMHVKRAISIHSLARGRTFRVCAGGGAE